MSTRIPATVITGFLGSGKTTLVRHMLNHAAGKRIALIINEFGDVGVDAELIRGCGDEACEAAEITELSNGCICCTVADDFIPAMSAILARSPRPDHIVIETSGLALPQPLIRAFNWPEIKAEVTVDGVIVVADAAALKEGRFAADEAAVNAQRSADPMLDHSTPLGELFQDQIVAADMIVLNKADMASAGELSAIEERLAKAARPGVSIIRAEQGAVDLAALLGLGMEAEADIEARPSLHETEHGGEAHEHDDFDSFLLRLPPSPDKPSLMAAISDAIRQHDILRLKGFAAIAGSPARLAVQATGPRIEAWFDRQWRPGEARETKLVVIGQSPLARQPIEAALGRAAAA
jgi:cobalamin biosynthesis protein CobW